jgi:hypothetical protein
MHACGLSRKRISNKVLGIVTKQQIMEYMLRHQAVVPHSTVPIVSVDECSFSEKVQPQYGWSQIGSPCLIRYASGGWHTRSLIMAVSSSGQVEYMMQDGGVKRYQFADFIARLQFPPGTVIIMDNCSIHKKLEHVFEAKQYKILFLPPYSPQLQPIELAFSIVKNHFRQLWPWKAGVVMRWLSRSMRYSRHTSQTFSSTQTVCYIIGARRVLQNSWR